MIHLAIGCQWYGLQQHKGRGDHIRGNLCLQRFGQIIDEHILTAPGLLFYCGRAVTSYTSRYLLSWEVKRLLKREGLLPIRDDIGHEAFVIGRILLDDD